MTIRLVSLKSPDQGFSKDLLGGKGYGLWKMTQAGLRVPPAMIITTDVCREYMSDPKAVMDWVRNVAESDIRQALCDPNMPLVSVRSGARDSMPGMMDTVLNVGLDDESIGYWRAKLGNECANDCYRRLVEMYANVVHGIKRDEFHGLALDEAMIKYHFAAKEEFPSATDQLVNAIEAVFKSWNNPRAIEYRNMHGIPHDLGTAVVVQAMVFGNLNDKSCAGVLFTRNDATGEDEVTGEFAVGGQGEDVVAGGKGGAEKFPIAKMHDWSAGVAEELLDMAAKLETMNRDMMDVEFTVQDGVLYLLQMRPGKRTARAAVKIAVDMVNEGLTTPREALARVTAKQLMLVARPMVDPAWVEKNPPHAMGLAASNGVATGLAVFSAKDAVELAKTNKVILISEETTPDDIAGMAASEGILTQYGGMTCHAAVNARSLDKAAVVGCSALAKVLSGWSLECSDGVTRIITAETKITIDSNSGAIWVNADVPTVGGASGSVKDFLVMLSEEYGYYEVATCAEEIVNPKRVVLPAYLLSVEALGEQAKKMAEVVDDLIIDLRDVGCDPISQPLASLFGEPVSETVDRVNVLAELKLSKVRVIPFGPISAGKLEAVGYSVVPTVKSVSDVYEAKGLVVADHEALEDSKDEIAKMLSLKKRAGEAVISLNCVPEIDKDAALRGVKFATTPMVAAVSLLG